MRQGMGTGPVGPSSWLVLFEGLDRINKFSWSTRVFSDWYFSVSVAEVRKPCRLSRKRGHHGLRCSYKALNSLAASVLQLCCLNSDSPNEWNVPSHIHLTSLCDMNDKMRTRQGTHVQPHQYLWAWGKLDTLLTCSLSFILARTSLLNFPGEQREDKEGKGRQRCLSSNFLYFFFFFFLQLWKQSKTSNLPFHWWWLLVLSSASILPSWSLSTLDRSKTSPGYICSLSCGRAHLSSHGRRQKGTTDLLVMS